MGMTEQESSFRLSLAVNVLRRHKLILGLVFIVTLLSMMLYTYLINDYMGEAVISMNYYGIERGENPNGTRFTINLLVSDEVLQDALEAAGLSERIEPQELREYLSIGSQTTSDPTEKPYYSSSYSLSFTGGMEWGQYGVNPRDMLDFICRAYQRVFYEKYMVGFTVDHKDLLLVDQSDFNDLYTQYSLSANQMDHYLAMRDKNEARTYVSGDNDTFANLKKRVNNLQEYTIKNFNTYLWEKGVLGVNSKLKQTMTYRNKMLEKNRKLSFIEYIVNQRVIREYDNAMSAVVLIPSEDRNDQFYMSRTKIGIDYLAADAYSSLDTSEVVALIIARNQDRIKKLGSGDIADDVTRIAKQLSSTADRELTQLREDIKTLDTQYVQEMEKDFFTVINKEITLLEKVKKKLSLITAMAVTMFIFAGLYGAKLAESKREG